MAQHALSKESAKNFKLLGQAETYLRVMHKLNQSLGHALAPVLEERHGLDLRLGILLQHIQGGLVHPGSLAQEMYLPKSVITRHLDRLAELGLIERALDPEDSRRIKLTLTRDGQRVAQDASRTIFGIVAKRLERLTPSQRETLISIFTNLVDEGC